MGSGVWGKDSFSVLLFFILGVRSISDDWSDSWSSDCGLPQDGLGLIDSDYSVCIVVS
jgi:hypothetical protein